MTEEILVLGEVKEGKIREVSFEAIAAARKLHEESKVTTVLLGENTKNYAETIINQGADKVITVENPVLNKYTTDAYMQALFQIIEKVKPMAVIMGHTAIGRDIAPRLAARMGIGLVTDVVNIEKKDGVSFFIRPIYSGKAFEKQSILTKPICLTIRPNNISPLKLNSSRSGEVTPVNVNIKDIRTVVKDIVRKANTGGDLSEAKIIVAGGRGVKSAEGFKVLEDLATVLGGALGASRGACDAEYCDYSLQIGQTGKVVTPDLYIAVGISGAIQHVAGMSNSKVIVAVNKDPEAPIFDIADYGIVGDLFEVIPKLTEALREKKV